MEGTAALNRREISESIDGGRPPDRKGPNKWAAFGVDALCEAPRRHILLKGKRILVTGADGFIGSHLAEALVEEGAGVLALCQYNSFNHWGWLEDLPSISQIEVVTGDIRDPHFCLGLTRD